MLARIALAVLLMFGGWQAAVAGVVRVADGDCAGLSAAVAAGSASSAPPATILLARNGNYSGCAIAPFSGVVEIDGQGSRMQGFSACATAPLVVNGVGPRTSISLRNMTISPSTDPTAQPTCLVSTIGMFASFLITSTLHAGPYSALSLESVTLQGFAHTTFPGQFDEGIIVSEGSLTLRNVTATQISDTLINSSGTLEIYNSTFAHNAPLNPYSTETLPLLSSYPIGGSSDPFRVTIANSLFAGNTGPVCAAGDAISFGRGSSLGGNVSDANICGLSAASGDKIVQSASLGTFGDNGGLVPTQAINGGGPAQGAGVAKYCEALDARGYTRAPNGCDAGAYEAGGGSGALTANGMNGVYYDPAANGHYVTLQRVHDNGDIVVVWNTFDNKGNQAWVYGVGQLSGKRIHVAASQNIGGILQLGGAPIGSTVRNWGTLDVDLNTCASAQLSYASTLDGFGSGTFPLTRLTVTQDFGCRD
jgi:hypothetical protein